MPVAWRATRKAASLRPRCTERLQASHQRPLSGACATNRATRAVAWRRPNCGEGHYFAAARRRARKSPVRASSAQDAAPHGARLAPTQAHARAADARRRAEPPQGADARPEPPGAGLVRGLRRLRAPRGGRRRRRDGAAPGERRDAAADACWRACADAAMRRVPPPRTLAVAWVPQLIQDSGLRRVEARALRRAVRARCVRPPLQRATTETLPARRTRTSSADEARRKLRDAALQVLLRHAQRGRALCRIGTSERSAPSSSTRPSR